MWHHHPQLLRSCAVGADLARRKWAVVDLRRRQCVAKYQADAARYEAPAGEVTLTASVRKHPSPSLWHSVSSGSPLSITASGWCGSLPYRPAYDQCDPDDWKRRKVLGTATLQI